MPSHCPRSRSFGKMGHGFMAQHNDLWHGTALWSFRSATLPVSPPRGLPTLSSTWECAESQTALALLVSNDCAASAKALACLCTVFHTVSAQHPMGCHGEIPSQPGSPVPSPVALWDLLLLAPLPPAQWQLGQEQSPTLLSPLSLSPPEQFSGVGGLLHSQGFPQHRPINQRQQRPRAPSTACATEAKRARLGRGSAKLGLMASSSAGVMHVFVTCHCQCPEGSLAASKRLQSMAPGPGENQ